jgi:hypothetical protein
MDECVTNRKNNRWTRGLVTKSIIAATNLCERTYHFVILGSQQDFGTFGIATLLKSVRPLPVVQLLHVHQQGRRERWTRGLANQAWCCGVVGGQKEHHCEGSKFVSQKGSIWAPTGYGTCLGSTRNYLRVHVAVSGSLKGGR